MQSPSPKLPVRLCLASSIVAMFRAGLIDLTEFTITDFDLAAVNEAVTHAAAHAGPLASTVLRPTGQRQASRAGALKILRQAEAPRGSLYHHFLVACPNSCSRTGPQRPDSTELTDRHAAIRRPAPLMPCSAP